MPLTLKDALQNVGDFAQRVATPENFRSGLGAFASARSPQTLAGLQRSRLAEGQSQAKAAENQLAQITAGITDLDKALGGLPQGSQQATAILPIRQALATQYQQLSGQPYPVQDASVLTGTALAAQSAREGVTEQNTIEREQRAEQARIETEGRALQTKVGAENRQERAQIREERRKEQVAIRAEGRKQATPKKPINMLFPDGHKEAYRPGDPKVDEAMRKGATLISQQASGPPGTFTGTKAQMGRDVLSRDFLRTTLSGLDSLIKAGTESPSLFGMVGSVRKRVQSVAGITTDVAQWVGEDTVDAVRGAASEIIESGQTELTKEEGNQLLNNPDVSNLKLFEDALGIALARLRNPEGRVPVEIIRRSIENVKLTGLTSSKDVMNRLKQVQRELNARLKDTETRLGASKDQRIRFDSAGNIIP